MTDPARDFGRLYANLVGEPRDVHHAAQRARLVMRLRQGQPPRAKPLVPLRVWAPASLLGVAAVAWLSLRLGSSVSPSLEANWQGNPVAAGAALVVSGEAAVPLSFSDGSEVVLEPSAQATLQSVGEKSTGLVLERGRLSAKLERKRGTAWTIAAGPYEVRGTGSTFTVDWDRASGFRIQVSEGSARVTGGDLPEGGVQVGAGDELSRGHRAETVTAPSPERPVRVQELPVVEAEETPEERPAGQTRAQKVAPEPLEPVPAEVPSKARWQSLAERGEYAAALRDAEAQGFEAVLSSSSASELLLLGNSARYARSSQRARQAYGAIRSRFAGSHPARLSAYYLARLSGDVDGQPRSEAGWLRTYLAESPGGELSASARARLMEVLRALGDAAGARSIARDYLRYHPAGPHAGVARSLLDDATEP